MLYKIVSTGKYNDDGSAGIFSRAPIHRIGPDCLILGEGTSVADIENETIELVEAEPELVEKYKLAINETLNELTEQVDQEEAPEQP